DLILGGSAGLQTFADLGVGNSTKILQQPLHVADSDIGYDLLPLFTLKSPLNRIVIKAFDEVRSLFCETIAIPFFPFPTVPPLTKRRAPVNCGVKIARRSGPLVFEYSEIGILRVPVGYKQHQDLEPLQFMRTHKGVVLPRPDGFLQILGRVPSQLETSVDE